MGYSISGFKEISIYDPSEETVVTITDLLDGEYIEKPITKPLLSPKGASYRIESEYILELVVPYDEDLKQLKDWSDDRTSVRASGITLNDEFFIWNESTKISAELVAGAEVGGLNELKITLRLRGEYENYIGIAKDLYDILKWDDDDSDGLINDWEEIDLNDYEIASNRQRAEVATESPGTLFMDFIAPLTQGTLTAKVKVQPITGGTASDTIELKLYSKNSSDSNVDTDTETVPYNLGTETEYTLEVDLSSTHYYFRLELAIDDDAGTTLSVDIDEPVITIE